MREVVAAVSSHREVELSKKEKCASSQRLNIQKPRMIRYYSRNVPIDLRRGCEYRLPASLKYIQRLAHIDLHHSRGD